MQVPKFWQSLNWQSRLLQPFSWLFNMLALYKKQRTFNPNKLSVPIIIVGNINVGGTGKTPICIELIKILQAHGYTPALISRGYGRKNKMLLTYDPQTNTPNSNLFNVENFGDEPYLIAQTTKIPIAVAAQRLAAAHSLLENYPHINIIISDDGLQHYALPRDIEIAVVGHYGFGNTLTLPAGPLREPINRLNSLDFVLYQSQQNQLLNLTTPQFVIRRYINYAYQLDQPSNTKTLHDFSNLNNINPKIIMLAGIAYPQVFFNMLENIGITGKQKIFSDHHQFTAIDFENLNQDNEIILMTEKDAVKCLDLNLKNVWVVPLLLDLPNIFILQFLQKLKNLPQKITTLN